MKFNRVSSNWTFFEKSILVVACGIASGALATELSLTNAPLFLDSSVQPNILFIVDDSGSMGWTGLQNSGDNSNVGNSYNLTPGTNNTQSMRRACAGANVQFYDPSKTYTPWVGVDDGGTAFKDQPIIGALDEPYSGNVTTYLHTNGIGFYPWYDHDADGEYDLSFDVNGNGVFDAVIVQPNGDSDFDGFVDINGNGVFDPGLVTSKDGTTTGYEFDSELECADTNLSVADRNTWLITVAEMSDTTQADIGFGDNPLTEAEMETNFANWYTYYRTRSYIAKRAISEIITDSTARIGLQTLNVDSDFTAIADIDDITTPVTGSQAEDKAKLLEKLFGVGTDNSTPLKAALIKAGEYFSKDTTNGGPILGADLGGSCQQNFAIMLTDGYQNEDPVTGTVYGNADSDSSSLYDNKVDATYADNEANIENTLADIAMYYYERDLRTDLDDEVPEYISTADGITDDNPAQHLVTYTVAFGVTGTIKGTEMPWETGFNEGNGWPTPANNSASSVDDVWHAAYNGRGLFLSAANPEDLITSLNATVQDLTKRDGSASAVAVNSGSISSTSMLFQAEFNSTYWSGQINGIGINDDGSLDATEHLASVVPRESQRVIVTHNGDRYDALAAATYSPGSAFEWSDLTVDQQTTLVSEDLVNYLRGDRSLEGPDAGDYRERDELVLADGTINVGAEGPLGDIINSSPAYVGEAEYLYPDWLENADYSSFRLDPDGDGLYDVVGGKTLYRNPVIYVGSNDGFLHGFNVALETDSNGDTVVPADFGKEIFAYVPSMVMDRMPELASQDYDHEYTVDGSPTVGDAFIDNAWHTVLVSGLNAGGQGIFALDVTNPNGFSTEALAAKNVLWEFSDEDDVDMGYSYSKPIIVKSNDNGRWVAIFGNGYNSTEVDGNEGTGSAVLYIVDLETGALIKKIDTEVNDRTVTNGLSSPVSLDENGDYIADYIYAGDLEGNLWKFDISSDQISNWGVAYQSGTDNEPLYTACTDETCTADNRQPITVQPKVGINRGATGHIIYFGTGTYITKSDNENYSLQSFYGIWDKQESLLTPFNRDHLLKQEILEEYEFNDGTVITEQRLTSRNLIDWHTATGLPADGTDADSLVDTHLGWYLDLKNTDSNFTGIREVGERVVSEISLRDEEVIFNTSIPNKNPCSSGGVGWFMALDATTGSGPGDPAIDVNLDGVFDEKDLVLFDSLGSGGEPVASSGTKTPALATGCVFVTLTDGSQVCLANTSNATVATIGLAAGAALGRWMWRELND